MLDLSSVVAASSFSYVIIAIVAIGALSCGVVWVSVACALVLDTVIGKEWSLGRLMDAAANENRLRDTKARIKRGDLVDRASRQALQRYEGSGSRRRGWQ